eukprot:3758665-Ditylum_brightwellii.AAC.1
MEEELEVDDKGTSNLVISNGENSIIQRNPQFKENKEQSRIRMVREAKIHGTMKHPGIATLVQLSLYNLIIFTEERHRVNGTLDWDIVINITARACNRVCRAITQTQLKKWIF